MSFATRMLGFDTVGAELPTSISASASTLQGGTASANISFSSAGTYSATAGGSGTWLLNGTAAEYEIRFTTADTLTSGTANAWLNLGTTRTFTKTRSTLGTSTVSGTIEISRAGENNALVSCPASIDVTVEAP